MFQIIFQGSKRLSNEDQVVQPDFDAARLSHESTIEVEFDSQEIVDITHGSDILTNVNGLSNVNRPITMSEEVDLGRDPSLSVSVQRELPVEDMFHQVAPCLIQQQQQIRAASQLRKAEEDANGVDEEEQAALETEHEMMVTDILGCDEIDSILVEADDIVDEDHVVLSEDELFERTNSALEQQLLEHQQQYGTHGEFCADDSQILSDDDVLLCEDPCASLFEDSVLDLSAAEQDLSISEIAAQHQYQQQPPYQETHQLFVEPSGPLPPAPSQPPPQLAPTAEILEANTLERQLQEYERSQAQAAQQQQHHQQQIAPHPQDPWANVSSTSNQNVWAAPNTNGYQPIFHQPNTTSDGQVINQPVQTLWSCFLLTILI